MKYGGFSKAITFSLENVVLVLSFTVQNFSRVQYKGNILSRTSYHLFLPLSLIVIFVRLKHFINFKQNVLTMTIFRYFFVDTVWIFN